MNEMVFIGLTAVTLVFLYFGSNRNIRIAFISVLWIVVISSIAALGFLENTNTIPPRFIVVVLGAVGMVVYFIKRIQLHLVDLKILTLLHVVRIPVEFGLYVLFLKGEVPKLMTFAGWNYDIFMGVIGGVVFLYLSFGKRKISPKLLIVWNIIGIVFLTIIVVLAFLSAPFPFQQLAFEQPNVAVAKFPFVLLPAYIVPIVYLSHILSIKKLKTMC